MTEDSDQHRDKRQKVEPDRHENVDTMEVERPTQPTNHDRNAEVKKEGEVPSEVVAEIDKISLDQLQKDMGDAFLLGRSSKALYVVLLYLCINLLLQNHKDMDQTQIRIYWVYMDLFRCLRPLFAQIQSLARRSTNCGNLMKDRLRRSGCLVVISL